MKEAIIMATLPDTFSWDGMEQCLLAITLDTPQIVVPRGVYNDHGRPAIDVITRWGNYRITATPLEGFSHR
jgi:hypothetical protein